MSVSVWQELNCAKFPEVSLVLREGSAPAGDDMVETFPELRPWQLLPSLAELGLEESPAAEAARGGDLGVEESGHPAGRSNCIEAVNSQLMC